MPLAYPSQNQPTEVLLSEEEFVSLVYHNIFEYPLTMAELIRWAAGKKASAISHREAASSAYQPSAISTRNGFYYLGNSAGIVLKRLMRKRISVRKLEIAKRAAKIISLIPTVKMVAVTGALAMENASDESDIDLMIVAKKWTLWTTRAFAYLLIYLFGIKFRRPGDARQKDKLCLNMWLDESDLIWDPKKRNIYTAHEIAQIRPIINRGRTYEEFISKNNWIREYWSNAVRVSEKRKAKSEKLLPFTFYSLPIGLMEKLAFKLQYAYMRKKITRETVTPTRALFHPVDWGTVVLKRFTA